MRAGRLKTRRYKTQRRRKGPFLAFLLLLLLAAGAWHFRGGSLLMPLSPAPTLSPSDSAPDQRLLTLSGKTWYALQLGAFEQEEAARSLADSYRGRGAGGYIFRQGSYRVLAAAYESRADAQAVQTQLRTLHGIDSALFEIPRPEITLRLTGQKAQLTALADALDTADQAAMQLSVLSRALDQREQDASALREALRSLQDTVGALQGRLQTLFGAAPHPAVQQLSSLLAELSRTLDQALAARGDTALGAAIKACQLLCISRLAQFAQGLIP